MREFILNDGGLERLVLDDLSYLNLDTLETMKLLGLICGSIGKDAPSYTAFIINGFGIREQIGNTYLISSGLAFINGYFITTEQQQITVLEDKIICVSVLIVDDEPRPFLDGQNKVMWNRKIGQLVAVDPSAAEGSNLPGYGGAYLPIDGITYYEIMKEKVCLPQSNWIFIGQTGAPQFQNNFGNITTGYPSALSKMARFRKKLDYLEFEGYITRSSNVSTKLAIFRLPIGFRPFTTNVITMVGLCGQLFFLEIASDGFVSIQPFSNISLSNPVRISLDGLKCNIK